MINDIKRYRIYCRECEGYGYYCGYVNIRLETYENLACPNCESGNIEYVDWIEYLKTPKRLRIDKLF